MKAVRVRFVVLFTFSILFICSVAAAQSNHSQSGGPAQGSLAVTVTVVPSVWLDMSSGKQEVVVANSSADPKESFSHRIELPKNKILSMRSQKRSPTDAQKSVSRDMPRAQQPENKNDAALQFSFPSPDKFEVRKETVVMDVSEGEKMKRRPVTVTTVVPQ